MEEEYEASVVEFISKICNEVAEKNYRRGFSHGYEVGLKTDSEESDPLRKKINDWRRDLDNKKGAPGTNFENQNTSH